MCSSPYFEQVSPNITQTFSQRSPYVCRLLHAIDTHRIPFTRTQYTDVHYTIRIWRVSQREHYYARPPSRVHRIFSCRCSWYEL